LNLAYPAVRVGVPVGAVVAVVSVEQLSSFVSTVGAGHAGTRFILYGHDQVIAPSTATPKAQLKRRCRRYRGSAIRCSPRYGATRGATNSNKWNCRRAPTDMSSKPTTANMSLFIVASAASARCR